MTCNIEAATEIFLSNRATLANLDYSGADQSFVISQISNVYSEDLSSSDITALEDTLNNNGYPSAGAVVNSLFNDFSDACALVVNE